MPRPLVIKHPVTGCRVDSLMGLWLIDGFKLEQVKDVVLRYSLKEIADENKRRQEELKSQQGEAEKPKLPYQLRNGVAVFTVTGPTSKYSSSFESLFGGSSTQNLIRAVNHARLNEEVRRGFMLIDSPGGTADGQHEWGAAVARFAKQKLLVAHGEDSMTSAAQWTSACCSYTSVNETCELGSIGTRAHLYDVSKKYDEAGIRVISLKTGDYKDAGLPGLKVTDKQIEYFNEILHKINDSFIQAVSVGRGLDQKKIRDMEARVFVGKDGVEQGLADSVKTTDQALSDVLSLPDDKFQVDRTSATKTKTVVVVPDRSRTMLTPEQLALAKALPGGEKITQENADVTLLQIAGELQTKATASTAATKLAEPLAKRFIGVQARELGLLVKEEKLNKEQLETLTGAMKVENVQESGEVFVPVSEVQKMLQINKPSGLQDDVTGDQTKTRTEPGAENGRDKTDEDSKMENTRKLNKRAKGSGGNGRIDDIYGVATKAKPEDDED